MKSSSNIRTDIIAVGVSALVIAACSALLYADYARKIDAGGAKRIGTLTFKKEVAQRKYGSQVIWEDLDQNVPVYDNDSIRTAELSEAVVRLSDGTTIRIDENSLILLAMSGEGINIDFSHGSIAANRGTAGEKAASKISITSKDAVVSMNSGDVRLSGTGGKEIDVTVREGSADIRSGTEEKTVRKDEKATVTKDAGARVSRLLLRLESPRDNDAVVTAAPAAPVRFAWAAVEGDARVFLEIARDAAFSRVAAARPAAGGSLTENLGEGSHYWRVRARNAAGADEYSEVRKISVMRDRPVGLVAPRNGEIISYSTKSPIINFRWLENRLATEYTLEISRSPVFSGIDRSVTTPLMDISVDGLGAGTYYWRVKTGNSGFASYTGMSASSSFRIERKAAPSPPVLIAPPDGRKVSSSMTGGAGKLIFSWSADSRAGQYEFTLGSDREMRNPVVREKVQGNYFALRERLEPGQYYWRVGLASGTGDIFSTSSGLLVVPAGAVIPGEPRVIGTSRAADGGKRAAVRFPCAATDFSGTRKIELARDRGFLDVTGAVTTTADHGIIEDVPAGAYYWRVRLYDDDRSQIGESEARPLYVSTDGRIVSSVEDIAPEKNVPAVAGEDAAPAGRDAEAVKTEERAEKMSAVEAEKRKEEDLERRRRDEEAKKDEALENKRREEIAEKRREEIARRRQEYLARKKQEELAGKKTGGPVQKPREEAARKLDDAAEKKRREEIARKRSEEIARRRQEYLARKKDAEAARGREDLVRRQEELTRKNREDLALKRSEEQEKRKQEALERKNREELARKRREELEKQRREEPAVKKRDELTRKREEDIARKKREDLALKERDELARKRREELGKQRREELAVKKRDELTRKREEDIARKKREDLALKERDELARKRREELEKQRREELATKKRDELTRKQEEETAKKNQEDIARQRREQLAVRKRVEALKKEAAGEEKTSSSLAITSSTLGSAIYVNSKLVGYGTARVRPTPGKRLVITIMADGYADFTQTLTMKSGEKKKIDARLVSGTADFREKRPGRRLRWRTGLASTVMSRPVHRSGIIVATTRNGFLVGMNMNGGQLWRTALGSVARSTPAADDSSVYLVTVNGILFSIDLKSGGVNWKTKIEGPLLLGSEPVVEAGRIFIATSYGVIQAYSRDGAEVWRRNLKEGIFSSMAYDDGVLYVGTARSNIFAISADDGTVKWIFTTDSSIYSSSPRVHLGTLFAGCQSGTFYAISRDGSLKWEFKAKKGVLSAPAFFGDTVCFGSQDGTVYALRAGDGGRLWEFQTRGTIVAGPDVSRDSVLVPSGNSVFSIDMKSGELNWKEGFPSDVNTPVTVVGDVAYLGLNNGDFISLVSF